MNFFQKVNNCLPFYFHKKKKRTTIFFFFFFLQTILYEPVTKGCDLKWDTLPQNQTPSKLFSVLPLESGMFQVTISITHKKEKGFDPSVLYGIKTGVRSGVDICNNGHSDVITIQRKNICMQF